MSMASFWGLAPLFVGFALADDESQGHSHSAPLPNPPRQLWDLATLLILAASIFASALLAYFISVAFNPHKQASSKERRRREDEGAASRDKRALRVFSMEEVGTHNKESDCWIIVKGKVYDVTEYVIMHPGGDAILNNAGADSTAGFYGPQHPSAAYETLEEYLIGTVGA